MRTNSDLGLLFDESNFNKIMLNIQKENSKFKFNFDKEYLISNKIKKFIKDRYFSSKKIQVSMTK